MKRFASSLAVAAVFLPACAFADTSVNTPKNLASKEEVALYVGKLEAAVKRECYRLTGPVIGVAVYTYQACIKATRADVASKEPTGLYAQSDSVAGVAIAAK